MQSVTHPPTTREHLNELIAELYGDTPASLSTTDARWQHAVAQVGEHLRAKLRVEALPERMQKALDLVRATAVTLHANGHASVQSGKQTYTLAPDCPCADAKHRTELCKHALAVELHRRALALFHDTDTEPTPTPAAPSSSPPAAVAVLPAARPAAPSAPAAALWGTTEAPTSCNIKLRVGNMELWYTARDVDDATLQQRLQGVLPWLKDVLGACEADYAARVAAQAAPAAPAPQAPPASQPTSAPTALQTLIQQALQQALSGQAANGQAPGTPPPAAPSNGQRQAKAKTGDQATGFCSLHNVAMEHRENERGSWYSHWLPEDERHCKGRR